MANQKKSPNYELLKKLSDGFGVTGFETEIQDIVKEELKGICDFDRDRAGSIICRHKAGRGSSPKKAKIGIFTHIDEVGFMVRGIMPSGFIKFITLGGWTTQTLPSQRVMIKNTAGKLIKGVIGMKPPHMLGDDERSKAPKVDSLYIDIGAASADEVINEYKIDLGCPIIPYTEFCELNKPNMLSGKAFDNRAGVTSMISIMKNCANLKNNVEVIGVGSSLEESGLRGAKTSSHHIAPDIAFVIDTPPADDTPNNETAYPAQGKLGAGPQIRLYDPTMIANPKLVDFIRKTAAKKGIKVQHTVRSSGGTDAGSVHLSLSGVPTVVIGIPTRYIHSHVGVLDINDIDNTVKLVCELIRELDEKIIASF